MNDKAVELAAKAFAVALLSALLMLVVGYAEVKDAKSNRRDAVRLQRDIAIVASYAEAASTSFRAYIATTSSAGDSKDERQIRDVVAAIVSARETLAAIGQRVVASSNLVDRQAGSQSRRAERETSKA